MAVYFDKDAWTFDQAPFEQSATTASVVNALKLELAKNYSLTSLAPEFVGYETGVTNFEREIRVRHTYIEGEILRNFPLYVSGLATIAGGPLVGIAVGGLAQGYPPGRFPCLTSWAGSLEPSSIYLHNANYRQ